jgi:hypothetical protein
MVSIVFTWGVHNEARIRELYLIVYNVLVSTLESDRVLAIQKRSKARPAHPNGVNVLLDAFQNGPDFFQGDFLGVVLDRHHLCQKANIYGMNPFKL